MERNNSNDQIKIDQETLNEIEDQVEIDQEKLNKYINDRNLDSLPEKICSEERIKELSKFTFLHEIIENLNKSGEKELVEKFLNFDTEKLQELSKFEENLDAIIKSLNESRKEKLVREFLNFNLKRLEELSKFIFLNRVIKDLNKIGGSDLVEKFLNLPREILEALSKFKFFFRLISKLSEYGKEGLVREFLNFDLNRLEILNKDEFLHVTIHFIFISEETLVKKFLNFDLDRLYLLIKCKPIVIFHILYEYGEKELIKKFLHFDLERLKELSKFENLSSIIEYLHKSGGKELVTKFISSDYHEFFKTLLLQQGDIDKKEVLSNFLIKCCNFNPEDKIDYIFKFIKENQEKPSNLNIFPFILGNIEFFKDNIITIENLDNIINQLTKDKFRNFLDKEKIKNYIKQNPIFELIKDNINYNENTSIDNLIEIYLNKLFNEQEFKDKKNTTILDKSLKDLIEASGISEKDLNIHVVELSSSLILEILSKNNKNQDLINFISKTVNLCSKYIKEKISDALNEYYLCKSNKSEIKETSRYFIKQILQTIIIFSFSDENKDVIICERKIEKNNETGAQISNEEGKSEEGKNIKDSFKINEFLKKIVSPIFKEVGINSEEDLLNFICEIDYLNQDSNKEYKVKFLDNKAFIISYLQKIFDLFKQETNMDVDSTQQFLNNNKIENQNQI